MEKDRNNSQVLSDKIVTISTRLLSCVELVGRISEPQIEAWFRYQIDTFRVWSRLGVHLITNLMFTNRCAGVFLHHIKSCKYQNHDA